LTTEKKGRTFARVTDRHPGTEHVDGFFVSDKAAAEVFGAILGRGPISRSEVARLTGLSQSTITKAVKPMLAAGYLVEEREEAQGRGRPASPLRVSTDRHYAIGVKLSPHEIVAVVANPRAEVLASTRRGLPGRSVDDVIDEVASVVEELLARQPEFPARVEGLGLALGGHVDSRGTLRYSPLLGWRDVPLASLLEAATGLDTVVENDVNALAVEEQLFGAGRGVSTFAVVTVGAGVGCGLVVHGELVHGSAGMAGEIGHIALDPAGDLCACGNRGCLETIASDRAILASIARDGGPFLTTIAEAALLAREGNDAARAAFARAGEALGRALAILANIVNPSRVVLSGEGVIASDLLMDHVAEALDRHTFANVAGIPEIVTRPLSDETWAKGAAANVLRHLISRPMHTRRGRPSVPRSAPNAAEVVA
jgi:predicted NBD/HSP70 family sugar kinase